MIYQGILHPMKVIIGLWLAFTMAMSATGLEFSDLHQKVQAPSDVATVTSDYHFTNKGSAPVGIAKADPSCSCLKVQISGGNAPGESGVIRVTFEIGNFTGTVDKSLAVFLESDPPEKPSIVLSLQVQIPSLVTLTPKTLRWELNGKPEPKTIQIQVADGQIIHVTGVKSAAAITYELKTLVAGKGYELVVTPVTLDAPSVGVIRIETDSKIARYQVQQAFTQVMKSQNAP
jgi:Protein of unknown function (DUF1573)